ncbi:MFS family permease [Caldalkalibacillus uzonensis]|uniref:MFS family permease n=2 Tax=Caldalkalibacillus uzonensis TaxID=353224 RepID=A0ABU0CNH9_9BACI|nr:MFS family permease [Caldalkalibacillus uzonensis]
MWFANFLIAGSLTMILPFLSLLIDTMGTYTEAQVQRWAGLVFGVTFVTAFLFSPVWGRIGDRYGRKIVLIILGFGVSLCLLLMGLVHSVSLLFIVRLFMGLFAGFIPMAQAFIAAQTPKEIAGQTLGSLQTGNVSGALLGPLIGGLLADWFGFTYTFILTSVATCIAALLVVIGVQEVRVASTSEKDNKKYSMREVVKYIVTTPVLLTMMLIAMLVHVAHFAIQPLLALYVSELTGPENLAFLAGMAFSAAGLGNLLFARQWGKIGDRFGYEKILIILIILTAVVYLPQAFVTSVWQLVILRFLLGATIGGIIPCQTAYVRQVVPLSIQGEILGYKQSFRFLGNALGPVIGGLIAAYYGIPVVFYVTCGLFIISACVLWFMEHREAKTVSEHYKSV